MSLNKNEAGRGVASEGRAIIVGGGGGNTLSRRTIVKGAAWSIPVIAASTALPAASASTGISITLTQAAPPVSLCDTYSDVVFNVKQNGVAAPNQVVTVTLAGGTTFVDGTTTKVLQSDAAGNVTVSGLVAKSPSGTVIAQVGTASAQTSLSAIAGTIFTSNRGSAWNQAPDVTGTVDTTAVGSSNWVVRNTDGQVFYSSGADRDVPWVAIPNPAGVTMDAVESFTANQSDMALGSDGKAYSSQNGSAWVAYPGVSNVTQISLGSSTWMALDSSGVAYWWNNAATTNPTLRTLTNPPGVTMTKIQAFESGGWWMGLGSDGKAYWGNSSNPWTPLIGPENTDVVDIGIGSRTFTFKNSVGQVFVADEYNIPVKPVTGPVAIQEYQVFYGGELDVRDR